jgi:hypothetical protein
MSESSLNKGGHGAMSMQPDEIAVAEALTLLECRYSKFIYSTYLADIAILKT